MALILQVEVEGDSISAEPSGKEDEVVSSSQADRVRLSMPSGVSFQNKHCPLHILHATED